ncbi:AAA family ATPase [Patescibacteria group bacterium]|nr:AAA family ATPase [Patescibacteria group bacterium]
MLQDIGLVILIVIFLAVVFFFLKKKFAITKTNDSGQMLQDMTDLAMQGKLDKVVGVEDVVQRLLHVLARKQKNNPLLLGEPGVGKTAVIEGLAQMIVDKEVPKQFLNKKIFSLNLAEVMSGTRYRGELEARLRQLLVDLEKNPRQNILFIDEIHMLEQARGSEGSLDIADILKPALARGDLNVIGATTWREYEKYIKLDTALDRRFQPILIHEPSRENAVEILRGVKSEYENFHGVCLPQESIEAAVDQSIKYVKDRFLPDKAFDLIDEACAKVSLETVPAKNAAYLGVVHAASKKVKDICKTDAPRVEVKDITDVIKEWKGDDKT